MKAIVNTAPGKLEWRDLPTPEPGPGQVRIRTAACGICATDLEMIAGWDRTGFPAIPGHEWSGRVEKTGLGVDKNLVGKRCVAENVLADGGEVGFEHQGGYAQFLITETANVYALPEDFPPEVAAMIEPLAVCVRGIGRLRLEKKESALVMGDGPIGLIMLSLLKAAGVKRIVVVGGTPARLALARELGAAVTINHRDLGDDRAGALIAQIGGPIPAVVEASGSPAAAALALDVAGRGGKILVLGDYAQARADFPWNQILHRELELIGSNASAGGWPEAVRLATSGSLPLHRLVSRRVPASQFETGISLARNDKTLVKIALDWSAEI